MPLRVLVALVALTATACEHPLEVPRDPGVVYLAALGEVPAAELHRAARALEQASHRVVLTLAPIALPTPTADGRADAGALLDLLLRHAPDDTFRIAGVTAAPLRATEHDSVIGYARRGERALLYSTAALPGYSTEAARRRTVRRIVAHEMGHTFGSGHCRASCVMRDTMNPNAIELMPDQPCRLHRHESDIGLAHGIDHPDFLADVAAERTRLGQWDRAIDAWRRALAGRPRDARMLTSLGVALMANGELTAAKEAFDDASRAAPEAPQPYYARAVLYAAGDRPERAEPFLEAAVERDGDPLRAHRAAGILYQDVLDDSKHALHHFEAHVRKGGRDREVITRLTFLLSPTTLVFTDPETIVARWQPGRGLLIASLGPSH